MLIVKLHQKINKELEATNENIKKTQNSILALIEELSKRDLEYSDRLLQVQTFKTNLMALEASKTGYQRIQNVLTNA